ncbi:MAG: cytochrome C [Cyanobacteria bacterium J06639_1]
MRKALRTWIGLAVAVAFCLAGWQALAQESVQPEDAWARYRAGAQLYVENCGSCHLAIPPEVLPGDTWRRVISDSSHYGVTIEPLQGPFRQSMWTFLRDFSRNRLESETVPYRVENSRHFKALHPGVTFESPVTLSGCVTCHPQAEAGNFIALSEAWR